MTQEDAASAAGPSLVAFLAARLDEDEAAAKLAAREGGTWKQDDPERYPGAISSSGGPVVYDEGSPDEYQAPHIARHDPARVLREVAAGRAILGEWQNPEWVRDPRQDPEMQWSIEHGLFQEGRDQDEIEVQVAEAETIDHVIRILAAVYGSHPGYRAEWAPTSASSR